MMPTRIVLAPLTASCVLLGRRQVSVSVLANASTGSARTVCGNYRRHHDDSSLLRRRESMRTPMNPPMNPLMRPLTPFPIATHSSVEGIGRSEEHTSELQSLRHLVC